MLTQWRYCSFNRSDALLFVHATRTLISAGSAFSRNRYYLGNVCFSFHSETIELSELFQPYFDSRTASLFWLLLDEFAYRVRLSNHISQINADIDVMNHLLALLEVFSISLQF